MPWLETDPVTERKRFIMEWLSGEFAVAELCRRHEISRKTGYKWIARYEREGPEGLEDRSKRPGNCPGAVEPDLIEEVIRIRYSRRQILGARKVRPRLVEGSSWTVRDLCRFLFDPAPDGRIGVSVFYAWIDARGYRDAWDYTVRFKQKLRQDALDKVELEVPEIDWDAWHVECASASS